MDAKSTKLARSCKLTLLQTITSGTLIKKIRVTGNTIVVGDIMRSITIFDFKETRQKITEGATSHDSIWTNCVLPLNNQQFIVFDKEKNIFMFERVLLPTADNEKFKLSLSWMYQSRRRNHKSHFWHSQYLE